MAREAVTSEAIVLRRVPYGDADLIVSLYTRSRGRLSALARSARKSRKRFGGCLGLFTVATMHLSTRKNAELWTLSSAELVTSYADLATDMACFAHASYGTELVRELTAVEAPDEDVLDLALALFDTLHRDGPSPMVLRAFELKLLGLIGLAPVIERCAGCGTRDVDGRGVVFAPNRGGVCCASCAALARYVGVRPLSGAARRVLHCAQQAGSLVEARAIDARPEHAAEARDALLAAILGHVGKPLRSFEFIAKLTGARQHRPR